MQGLVPEPKACRDQKATRAKWGTVTIDPMQTLTNDRFWAIAVICLGIIRRE